jgi:hypothetical protein
LCETDRMLFSEVGDINKERDGGIV